MDRPHQLLLRHRPAQAAKIALNLAQVPDFVSKLHDLCIRYSRMPYYRLQY
jgi:hypothetical protein